MSNLLKRLRMQRLDGRSDEEVMREAADEIERLAHCAKLTTIGAYWHNIDDQREIARLRALLDECRGAVDIAADTVIPEGRPHWERLAEKLDDVPRAEGAK